MTLALAAASIFTMSAFAQSSADNCGGGRCTQKKEMKCKDSKKQDKKKEGKKDSKKDGKKGGKQTDRMAQQRRQLPNPFEGLNLTAQQQQAIEALPTPGKVMQAARQGAMANGQSAAATQASNRLIAKDVRAKYLKEVRSVLSADQYVQFLENSYVSAPAGGKAQGMKGMKQGDRNGRDGRKVAKDFKGERAMSMTAHNR